MGIRESLLNTITSVGNGDFIRIVTSAGASSKATLANVFKSFESGLGAKSNLGTSDYVRVVGSDNNSYKQSMQSVIDTINAKNATEVWIADCNNATDPTKVYTTNGNTTNRPPVTAGYWYIRVGGASGQMLWQIAETMDSTSPVTYVRKRNAGGTWGGWYEMPTRDEIDELNSKVVKSKDKAFTELTNTADTYYISLGNVYTAFDIPSSSTILNVFCTSDSAFRNILSLQVSSGTLFLLFPYGHKFTNAALGLTVVYM